VSERETVTQINLASIEAAEDESQQKIFGAHVRKLRCEIEHNRLIDAQPLHPIGLLVECLEQRRGRFRVQDGAWMRFERNDSGGHVQGSGPLDHSTHYQLMGEMKPIEHAKGKNRRRFDPGVVNVAEDFHLINGAHVASLRTNEPSS
jgi:hypothetical protein